MLRSARPAQFSRRFALAAALSLPGSSCSGGPPSVGPEPGADLDAVCAKQCACTPGGGAGSTSASGGAAGAGSAAGDDACEATCLEGVEAFLGELAQQGCDDEYDAFLRCAEKNATCVDGALDEPAACERSAAALTECRRSGEGGGGGAPAAGPAASSTSAGAGGG